MNIKRKPFLFVLIILIMSGFINLGNTHAEIQINKTVSGENWAFTVVSVENTGLEKMRNAATLSGEYMQIKDDDYCFWWLTISANYKKAPTKPEEVRFKSNWIQVFYSTKDDPYGSEAAIKGFKSGSRYDIADKDSPYFGHTTATKGGPAPAEPPISEAIDKLSVKKEQMKEIPQDLSFSIKLLFVAPRNTEKITSMRVEFLDYPGVQVIPIKGN